MALNETLRVVAGAGIEAHGRGGAVMGKPSRQKRQRRREAARRNLTALSGDDAWPTRAEAFAWMDHDGLHRLVPGEAPSPSQLEEMSGVYQDKIRQSPLWDQMVAQFGLEEAERMLSQFRVELRN